MARPLRMDKKGDMDKPVLPGDLSWSSNPLLVKGGRNDDCKWLHFKNIDVHIYSHCLFV